MCGRGVKESKSKKRRKIANFKEGTGSMFEEMKARICGAAEITCIFFHLYFYFYWILRRRISLVGSPPPSRGRVSVFQNITTFDETLCKNLILTGETDHCS